MSVKQSDNNQLLENAVLTARIEVKEHFVNGAVKTIYDNVAQALSLLMVNLSLLQINRTMNSDEQINESKSILGQSIRDLRLMAAQLIPENRLTTAGDFTKMVAAEVSHSLSGAKWNAPKNVNAKKWIQPECLIIAFSLILILLEFFVANDRSVVTETGIQFQSSGILFEIKFDNRFNGVVPEMLADRMQSIHGRIEYGSVDRFNQSITLHIPLIK